MTIDDERLAAILHSVGEHLDTSPALNTGRNVRWRVAAFVALLLASMTITVPPIRAAVQRLLRIGNTTIEIAPTTNQTMPRNPSEPTKPDAALATGLTIVDRSAASSILAAQVPALTGQLSAFDRSALGVPEGYAAMPEGGVMLVWRDGSTLWIHGVSVRPQDYFRKMVNSDQLVVTAPDVGDDSIAIEGTHWLTTPYRTVVSTSTVLWVSHGLEFRLESNRPISALIEIARSID